MPLKFAEPTPDAVPIHFVARETWPSEEGALSPPARAFSRASGFEPKPGRLLLVPEEDGAIGTDTLGAVSRKPGVLLLCESV